MSLSLLWLTVASAGTALYAREPLPAGEPIRDDQVYAVEIPDAVDVERALHGPRSEAIGKTPRFDLPADTRLFPHHFEAEPDGAVAVQLPARGPLPRAGDRVDLWVQQGSGWCRLVEAAPVAARTDDTLDLLIPRPQAVGLPERSPALVLRHPLDARPSPVPSCPEAP